MCTIILNNTKKKKNSNRFVALYDILRIVFNSAILALFIAFEYNIIYWRAVVY